MCALLTAWGHFMNRWLFASVILMSALPAVAVGQSTELYQCKGTHGEPVFQDQPCGSKEPALGAVPEEAAAPRPMSHQTVTLNFRHIELAKVIAVLSEAGNVNIQLDPKADRFVDVTVVDTPWDVVLRNLLQRYNLQFRVVNGVGYIH